MTRAALDELLASHRLRLEDATGDEAELLR